MNKSIYTRPDKPRWMIVPDRERVPEREPVTVPKLVTVDRSTECFVTPGPVIDLMLDYAGIEDGHHLLEPSAGTGAIANRLRAEFPASKIDVFELAFTLRNILKEQGYNLTGSDFLESGDNGPYDRILMNPPFRKLADIDHVLHAYSCLKPGGRLVAIMGAGAFFNSQNKAKDFRSWLDCQGGEFYDLPEDSFKDSGTGVNSKIIIIDKD